MRGIRDTVIILGAATTLTVAALPQQAPAAWSQWRGSERTGVASLRVDEWPDRLEHVWSATVGLGHSSPVVDRAHVYQFAREGELEILRALDLSSGGVAWSASHAAPYEMNPAALGHGPGPKSTPVIHDGMVFTLGISGILSAHDASDGSVLWRHEYDDEFSITAPDFGTAMSPMVWKDTLIAHVGGNADGALIAVGLTDGVERWRWNGDGPGYASPIVVATAEGSHLITQTQNHIVSVDPDSGQELWIVPFHTDFEQNSVTALAVGDRVVASGLDQGVFELRMLSTGGTWTVEEAWRNDEVPMYMSSAVQTNGRLFGFSHRRAGQLFALDASSGEVVWRSVGRDGENASLVSLGDHVVVLNDEATLRVIDATADELRVVAEYEVADTPTWAHPAMLEDGLLVKDRERLIRWRLPAR